MSNSRSHRRRVKAAKVRATLADADAQAPVVVFGSGRGDGSGELHQPIVVNGVMHLVMVPPAGASDALLSAYSARATASITGRCPACGARRHVRQGGHLSSLTYHHEHDCPAATDNINAALRSEGFGS